MIQLKLEKIDEFNKIVKEEYGKEISDAEVSEIANGLVNYFDLLHEIASREVQLEHRLKTEPLIKKRR